MTPRVRKIVVPVDFTNGSEWAASYSCALAGEMGAKVYLIHVVPRSPLRTGGGEGAGVLDRLSAEARSRLARLAWLHPSVPVTTEVRVGAVAENITSAAVAYGADVIVMATHRRTGLSHWLARSITEAVSHSAPCPVLVIRESGPLHRHTAA